MRGAVHRILCIPRKLLETCRLRVRFCPAGIGRRLQRGGKQQKRRLAKSLTGHDCRDRHNSIGADYAESVHNSGGSVEPGFKKSNTEREIETALRLARQKPKFRFLSYFRDVREVSDAGPEMVKVSALKERLGKRKIIYRSFQQNRDFAPLLTHDLYETLIKIRHHTNKQRALRNFWRLGVPDKAASSALAIVYPAIGVSDGFRPPFDWYWLKRLVPGVVFEDSKALRKIEKTLRLIEITDFHAYSTSNKPSGIEDMNRVWICLPRNARALDYYASYANRVRFTFKIGKTIESEAALVWRTGNDEFTIRSPLSKYLAEQRRDFDTNSGWDPKMGNIVAKDYAVLARMHSEAESPVMQDGVLKDFFLAGIRGLGTWGLPTSSIATIRPSNGLAKTKRSSCCWRSPTKAIEFRPLGMSRISRHPTSVTKTALQPLSGPSSDIASPEGSALGDHEGHP